jgi:4-alpha-glucanotransferase
LPFRSNKLPSLRLIAEDGAQLKTTLREGHKGAQLSDIDRPGYYRLELGDTQMTLAVAPPRCFTIADIVPDARLWGLAVQAYGLRNPGDCGIGDMAGVTALTQKAAALKADALALSPVHALFADDPTRYSPYAPSSRLFFNPLHADARSLFGENRVQKAAANAGAEAACAERGERHLIDWPTSAKIKMAVFRRLFEDFSSTDLVAGTTALALDFCRFRDAGGSALQDHAVFETLHAARLSADPTAWSWREWPAPWRDPHSDAVERFALENENEVLFHCFLQWIADRSLAAAQQTAKQAGMRVGLIADLAVGMSSAGSHAWTNQQDILGGLEIGAPPDLYNQKGQNWGLTTFSPRALHGGGFTPFIATLRACLRHCGGVRIDHAMGLLRLWVIPHGADPREGAYLAYPINDLLRLAALESYHHRAIVIGEDLGTVPRGFRSRLAKAGIYGMRVLWFERRRGRFLPPQNWSADTVAMTSTHDLPTVAGWWSGRDIRTRSELGLVADREQEQTVREQDRRLLWQAFRKSNAAKADMPPPNRTAPVADAAVDFISRTPSQLALLPLEDALGLQDQPNLPGTIDQHPNWRRRYPGPAAELLDPPEIRHRLAPLADREDR